jgi:hypothetical protein
MYKSDVTSLLYLTLHLLTGEMRNPCGQKCDEIVLYFENFGPLLKNHYSRYCDQFASQLANFTL